MTQQTDADTTVEWLDAPPPQDRRGGRPGRDWTAIAEELRANPGKWRMVADSAANTLVSKIKNGHIPAFRLTDDDAEGSTFSAVSRHLDPLTRRGEIWAAWIPYEGES